MQSPVELRSLAARLDSRAAQCEVLAGLLETRAAHLGGILDAAILLHTPETWDSPTAVSRRERLIGQRTQLDLVRIEILGVAINLRSKAETDQTLARRFRIDAGAIEAEANQRVRLTHADTATATPAPPDTATRPTAGVGPC